MTSATAVYSIGRLSAVFSRPYLSNGQAIGMVVVRKLNSTQLGFNKKTIADG